MRKSRRKGEERIGEDAGKSCARPDNARIRQFQSEDDDRPQRAQHLRCQRFCHRDANLQRIERQRNQGRRKGCEPQPALRISYAC